MSKSLAESFCNRFKTSKNKSKLKLKMQNLAVSRKKIGSDYLYTMSDYSKLMYRTVVDEWQIFDTRILDITEEMALLAIRKYPKLAAKLALTSLQSSVYLSVTKLGEASSADISEDLDIGLETVATALRALHKKDYVSRKTKGVSSSGGCKYMYSAKFGCVDL